MDPGLLASRGLAGFELGSCFTLQKNNRYKLSESQKEHLISEHILYMKGMNLKCLILIERCFCSHQHIFQSISTSTGH